MKDTPASTAEREHAESRTSGRSNRYARLTARERQVLDLLAEGMSNKMISRRLDITPATVKCHVGKILAALGAGNRLEAVVVAARLGLLGNALGKAGDAADEDGERGGRG